MRRRAYWWLNAAIEFLDDNVYRLRALADKLDPGFQPLPRDYNDRVQPGHRLTEQQMKAEFARSGGLRLTEPPSMRPGDTP